MSSFFKLEGRVLVGKEERNDHLVHSQNGQNGLIHQTDAMVGAGSHQPL